MPEARPGSSVSVRFSSGDEDDFVVTRSEAVREADAEGRHDLRRRQPTSPLALITCDPTTQVKGGHYVANWVDWASPALDRTDGSPGTKLHAWISLVDAACAVGTASWRGWALGFAVTQVLVPLGGRHHGDVGFHHAAIGAA